MLQRLFTLAILILTILWIVISYLPGVRATLPTFAFPMGNGLFATFAVIALLVFLAIQIWLVVRTVKTVRHFQDNNKGSPFRLNIGAEFFWTALPIAMTLVLAWASYPLWLNTW